MAWKEKMTALNVEEKPRKAMNPDRLRKFIDSPGIVNSTRDVPMAIVKRQTQFTSWNGEQCDVREFQKLAPPANVVLAKDLRSCPIGEGKPVPLVRSGLQTTDVAVRLGKKIVMNCTFTATELMVLFEFCYRSKQEDVRLTAPLMVKNETFAHAAEIEHRAVPASIMLKEGIMTPQQRRERLLFETDHLQAKRAIHQADMNDRRLHQIIKERHFTSDVVGTQHHDSDAPRVRGEAYKSDLLSHNGTEASRREYQSKNGNANPRLQHHDRLFNETPLDWNQQRAQHLRNESTGGRSFNIINGGRVEYFPPTIPEKQHQWQAHPSVGIHPYTR
ncbi:hypothetical protein P3T76_009813 [Phytophthora citrophthora]|uniref:Uncharacterized protein n=1 Tax=Phytophthora citrophthora TaxID=4793 RepID=A0AAD9GEW5_9STRA|nr:hypothetical protein P3T76_009813 [Phytophthora citrophthora]